MLVKYETISAIAFMIGGSLLAAAFVGFSFLKFYEEFRKGVAQNSRLRIWSSFFGAAFVVIFFITVIMRLA